MAIFNWIAAIIVIVILIYVSFVLTLRDYLVGLHKGETVTLLPERGGRKYPFWAQLAIVILGLVLYGVMLYFLWIPLFVLSAGVALALDIIGLLLFLGGCAFVLWARGTLGKMWGISTSRDVKLREDHQLIQNGPYAFVRNPMYFGWWVAMLGLVLLYPVWIVVLTFLFSVLAFTGRARREESFLSERFGEAWAIYKKRTKFLVPFIY